MKGRRALEAGEADLVMRHLPSWRDRAIFATCLYTGARISEALGLDLADVFLRGGEHDVELRQIVTFWKRRTKGQKTSRMIKVHPELRRVLERYIERVRGVEPGPLFLADARGKKTASDGRLSRVQAWRVMREAFLAAGLSERTGTHSLRKTFAQQLADLKTPLPTIQELMGHRNVRDTREYFRVDESQMAEAVQSLPALQLDDLPPVPGDDTP